MVLFLHLIPDTKLKELKPDEYVIPAHFDSWDGGQGTTDNGTGTLVMLEAMRILKLAYLNPKRTICRSLGRRRTRT